MNERFLSGQGAEQIGQAKIGVVRIRDLLGGGLHFTYDLCDLLDTCEKDEQNQTYRAVEAGLPRL